jgi:O-antigen/teichoic acid export membrane protein
VNGTDVTFGRALKIWWSYVWRAVVLMMPVMIIAIFLAALIVPFPKAGQPTPMLRPDQIPGMASKMFGVWLFMMVFYIAAQVQAMRWMLKTKWSDFRLQAVSDG